uniref:Uncharacterized protein n=1 Tax=Meloidogyne enterolobii TaxID=390850 RepID=A0A6V7UTX8_MELEN|nr:unnamed protein product [Meloidogyne enterolobii]
MREKALARIEIIFIFEILWKLQRDNLSELSSFWDKNIKTNGSDSNKVELLKEYWQKRYEEEWNNSSKIKFPSISQPNKIILNDEHAMAIKQLILQFEEFRKLIRQRGSKSQIIQLFELDYNKINLILELNNVKNIETMNDLVFLLLKLGKFN